MYLPKRMVAPPTTKSRRENARRSVFNSRQQVLAAFGGKCACCGCPTDEFLSIDHINNDGSAHRRALFGNRNASGARFYYWLKRNGMPQDGLQLLCMNCNTSKQFRKYCPHLALEALYGRDRVL